MTDVSEARNAQLYALPLKVGFVSHISPSLPPATKAQTRIATHAAGTMAVFAINNHLRLLGCIYKNGICMSQNRKKHTIVLVAIPSPSGISFLRVRNEGQMAPSITRTVFAPFMVWMANQKMARIARDMMAM